MDEELIQEAIIFIREISNIELTRKQFNLMIKDKHDLVDLIQVFGVYGDTENRGMIANLLSYHLIGKNWPTYQDNIDIDKFVNELQEAASKLP